MKTLLTILTVGSLAAHTTVDTSGLLQHVKFQSSNFENILTWDGGPASTSDTVYSVEYKKYGERKWLAKAGCQRITQKFCNLTMETRNHTEFYYAKVTAVSAGGPPVTKMTDRFSSLQHTTIKPPDVTCIPKVRSIQMLVHPTLTPVLSEDGHQLTLEEIFHDLFYRLELHVNHTYQMHLEGKQREYEFLGLTPDTEFLGSITILTPILSKESAPYVCRVKTLPDRTWAYSFSGAVLFSMGFLVGLLCYLGYKYITKPPVPPNSLNVQRVLTFQPLRFIQEHVLIPVLDLSGPSSLPQPIQYSQVVVSGPREPPGAVWRQSLSDLTYVGQSDVSILQPTNVPAQQTLSPPSYAPKAVPEVQPPSYAPQVASDAKALFYSPQQGMKTRPATYDPQDILDSCPASYAVCVEDSGKDSTPGILSTPKYLKTKGQLQEDTLVRSCLPGDLSLQKVTSLGEGETQRPKSLPSPLGFCTDRGPDLHTLRSEEPETPRYLKGALSLLSSVQIEGHPVSLPLHVHSVSCSPSDEGPSPWGLLDSLVCPKDEGPAVETEAMCPSAAASELEQSTELDSLFKGLALTVQWES
ncbi:interleukin-22 receptor subunit alpha-1 precursor [Mus musculus]|uniref:Interleukin-22 receptor subunit alpha-1 n=1 Tax=Mus musculus TaxID=10090 RepID=I22R1_MOUSE|nr:interleukin-22 receptor subunit alpha-1 precursor [Mus musculus]Q80XZ4.1 RecName: Full=Interleukin-22 receptor subunit alpha-1; Short=IL-22 receptor subunit alpha-1; Short=IL-22R-alpha-1; Short=IL-22RA1; Flags: Precursor [Mus musculus]AAI40973.1 Interleukin 22 receptor, alpha 1 [Mus musculus]AAI40974.1 Interleukin 22 receptor, alpha 1 [Mus musculus]AAM52222.1 interleukin-22 receptor alpha chain [Mus musculus]|eukprot:NP_839988.1 interleukin-22 receptor subunit alpha-1 precursor [Mus musculus]